ncbi:hypothetical protein C8J56DRAFT_807390 [Mycena floridula]|nr:hypothetical protein C8J56DRAFT_807390 [Mycena floridula]
MSTFKFRVQPIPTFSSVPAAPVSSAPVETFTHRFLINPVVTPSSSASSPPSDASSSESQATAGSFARDLQLDKYNIKLASAAEIQPWIDAEECSHTIELLYKQTRQNQCKKYKHTWTEKVIYVCSRQGSGGKKKYNLKNPPRHRKISQKRTGCSCRITFKKYPDTECVLGFYNAKHDHQTGQANAPYTRVRHEDRIWIAAMLRMGIEPQRVLDEIQGNIHKESNLNNLRDSKQRSTRSEFITMADIRRIQKGIEAEDIRMHAKDSLSTLEWVNRCREDGLFTVVVCDKWGHGVPAGWMLSSNAKEVTTDFFLDKLRQRNLHIIPENWMSDFDKGQINSIRKKYPESARIFRCWWHVLHAWQQYFVIAHYPELWALLKGWIHIADPVEFEQCWLKIQAVAPDSVITYLMKNWLLVKCMWSAVFRIGRTIWQDSDTNMLLKIVPYYIARRHCQDCGFGGPNLEVKKRREVTERAESIGKDSIEVVESGLMYKVKSQSGCHQYDVDIDAYHCSCLSFPLINFCKHICAVQTHFPSEVTTGGEQFVCDASEKFAEFVAAQPGSDDESDDDIDEANSEISISVDSLVDKLHSLSIRTRLQPPSQITQNLKVLDEVLTNVLNDIGIDHEKDLLPRRKHVALHQGGGWQQTQQVMGAKRKGTKTTKHIDGYSGNKASGKKAEPDARAPKRRKIDVSIFSLLFCCI